MWRRVEEDRPVMTIPLSRCRRHCSGSSNNSSGNCRSSSNSSSTYSGTCNIFNLISLEGWRRGQFRMCKIFPEVVPLRL